MYPKKKNVFCVKETLFCAWTGVWNVLHFFLEWFILYRKKKQTNKYKIFCAFICAKLSKIWCKKHVSGATVWYSRANKAPKTRRRLTMSVCRSNYVLLHCVLKLEPKRRWRSQWRMVTSGTCQTLDQTPTKSWSPKLTFLTISSSRGWKTTRFVSDNESSSWLIEDLCAPKSVLEPVGSHCRHLEAGGSKTRAFSKPDMSG